MGKPLSQQSKRTNSQNGNNPWKRAAKAHFKRKELEKNSKQKDKK